jgi:HAD superfamily hydrolase (TIGR01509 family)
MTAARTAGWPVAVLFDMDGLLIDSEPVWSVAEAELMAELGGSWNAGMKAALIGKHLEETASMFLSFAPGSGRDEDWVMAFLLRRMRELFGQELPWRPGARELLDALGARAVPLALVSSSYRSLVDAALVDIGADRFAVTVAGDEVEHPKPDPEPYLRAALAVGVPPESCIVLEDSMTGVLAGEAAGCVVVGVPGYFPLPEAPGRRVVPSLVDIDPDWLLRLVRPAELVG